MQSCPVNDADSARPLPARGWRRWLNFDQQIWLVYVGFWFIQPYYDRAGLRQWLGVIAAAVLLITLYVMAHHGNPKYRWFWLLAMMVMGLAYVPFNLSACGIFIYVAASLPAISDATGIFTGLLTAECLIVMAECLLLHFPAWVWGVGVGLSIFVGMNSLRRFQKYNADTKLRMAHEEIERLAKTAERSALLATCTMF